MDENESSIYIYKDFGSSGTTFHKAFSAPLHCDDNNRKRERRDKIRDNKRNTHGCNRLLYPELQGCVLTPITSRDELLRVQSVIPPEKAAYTAVHKDRLVFKTEADKCYSSNNDELDGIAIELSNKGVSGRISSENCRVENWMEGLTFGYNDQDENVARLTKLNNTTAKTLDPCESLKSGWTNYKTGTEVPSSLWKDGQPSYCNLGPIQEVGAVWAVEADGQNYGDLRDVSTNWLLPGAVYKCCKTIYSCFGGTN